MSFDEKIRSANRPIVDEARAKASLDRFKAALDLCDWDESRNRYIVPMETLVHRGLALADSPSLSVWRMSLIRASAAAVLLGVGLFGGYFAATSWGAPLVKGDQLTQALKELADLHEETEELGRQLDETKKITEDLGEQLVMANATVSSYEGQLADAQARIDVAMTQLATVQSEASNSGQRLEKKQQTVVALKQQLGEVQGKLRTANTNLAAAKRQSGNSLAGYRKLHEQVINNSITSSAIIKKPKLPAGRIAP